MEYTSEFLKKIVQMGILGYGVNKVINVLDVEDVDQFTADFDDPNSIISKEYSKGIDKADFMLDSKLFEMAKNGNLNALKEYESRKKLSLQKEKNDKQKRDILLKYPKR